VLAEGFRGFLQSLCANTVVVPYIRLLPRPSVSFTIDKNLISEPGSSGSIVSGYGLDYRGSISGRGERIFLLASVSIPTLGPTQSPVQWVPGDPFPRVKARPGRDADHSPHLVPGSRMSRSCTSSPPKRPVACSGTVIFNTNADSEANSGNKRQTFGPMGNDFQTLHWIYIREYVFEIIITRFSFKGEGGRDSSVNSKVTTLWAGRPGFDSRLE
jgi:hypothetical protein